jgi:hypothetical protein
LALDIKVKACKYLTENLSENQIAKLMEDFFQWKRLGLAGEFDSFIFGKDSLYKPPASPLNTLSHVHMLPPNNDRHFDQWVVDHNRRPPSRKTSNVALVYATYTNSISKKQTFLLIGFLENPDAHEIPKRQTQDHKDRMARYNAAAAEFIQDFKRPAELINEALTIPKPKVPPGAPCLPIPPAC